MTRVSAIALVLAAVAGCSSRQAAPVAESWPLPIPPQPGPVETAFAMRFINVEAGTGVAAAPRRCLYAHYTGWLTDGTKFDSSRDTMPNGTPRTPISFPQGARRVIAGWEAGFEGMRVGGRRRLIIPYQLAYGELGRPPVIPARATLIFDVELMAVADTLPRQGQACPTWAAASTDSAMAASVAAELLSADRAFGAAAARATLADGIAPMLAADVSMPAPPGVWIDGRDAVLAALRSHADAAARYTWAPLRAGVSGDGRHGFTYGYAVLTRPDSTRVPGKYVTYWVREDAGWRARVWRRIPRGEGAVSQELLPPALPPRLVPLSTDATRIAQYAAELSAAENAFSAEAGRVGLAEAFRRNGTADAMNVGGPNDAAFVIGNDAIAAAVGGETPGQPSSLTWGADRAVVASSGDLGVTLGFINFPAPAGSGAPARRVPFFTVWRRESPSLPWRYVAE